MPEATLRDSPRPAAEPPAVDAGFELLRGAAINVLAIVAGAFRSVFLLLIARLLGSAALGTFALSWAWVDLISKVAGGGLGVSLTPRIASLRGDSSRQTRTLLMTALATGLVGSVATAVLVSVAVTTLGERLLPSPELTLAISVMVFALPGVILYRVSNAFSRGLKLMSHNLISRGLTESLVTVAAFLIVYSLGGRELAPVMAMIAGTAAGGIVALLLALGVSTGAGRCSAGVARSLIGDSLPVAGYGLVNLAIMRLDVLVLGLFVGRDPGLSLGAYGAYCGAVEIANVMRRVRQSFEPIYMPMVASRIDGSDLAPIRPVVAQMGRWTLALQLPLVGVLLLCGSQVLAVLGQEFQQAAAWLSILVIAQCLYGAFGLGEAIFLAVRPTLNLGNSIAAAVTQLGVSLLLIPELGATGAALGVLAAYGVLGVLRYVGLRYLLSWRWPMQPFARPLINFAVALGVALSVRPWLNGPAGSLALALMFVATYVGLWWMVGLEDDDRQTLGELRRRWQRRGAQATAGAGAPTP